MYIQEDVPYLVMILGPDAFDRKSIQNRLTPSIEGGHILTRVDIQMPSIASVSVQPTVASARDPPFLSTGPDECTGRVKTNMRDEHKPTASRTTAKTTRNPETTVFGAIGSSVNHLD